MPVVRQPPYKRLTRAAKTTAKAAAQRAELADQLGIIWRCRTRTGRRGYRDDRNLRLVMAGVVQPDSNCLDLGPWRRSRDGARQLSRREAWRAQAADVRARRV